ncbi:hypothetical protein X975_04409, partial [Stegodyphus mimosarum]
PSSNSKFYSECEECNGHIYLVHSQQTHIHEIKKGCHYSPFHCHHNMGSCFVTSNVILAGACPSLYSAGMFYMFFSH